MDKNLAELGVELRTARERLAHCESFSSATIAVLDGRIRQLVTELERTVNELEDLKEDSEKRIAALEEEKLRLHRAIGLSTREGWNQSPGSISPAERKARESGTGASAGPEIEPRSASPLDFLFRRYEPSLQAPLPRVQTLPEQLHSDEVRGKLEASPVPDQKSAGEDSIMAETQDRSGQGRPSAKAELRSMTDEIADNPVKGLAALEQESLDLQQVIAERRIALIEEENVRLNQAIVKTTGGASREGPGDVSTAKQRTPEAGTTASGGPDLEHVEARGGLEAPPASSERPAGADSILAETRDSCGQDRPTAAGEIKSTTNEIADLQRVVAERRIAALEEENMRLHRAIAQITGGARNESQSREQLETAVEEHPSAHPILPSVPESPLPSNGFEHRAAETTESVRGEGEVQLIISPFSSFGAVNRFTSALRSMSGVSSATIRRFQKGRLQVSVEYFGVAPLAHRLEDLREFRVRVIESSPERLEASIESPEERGQVAPSRGVQG